MPCCVPDLLCALPGVDHWTAVKNILKYLKRTKDMFLVYGGDEELVIKGYVDASFNTDLDDSKSQTGYVYILNGGVVSWCSSKQSVMAGSTCEAEYIAASEGTQEAVWMKEFITNLGEIPNASGQSLSSVTTLELLPLPRSPGFTGRPGISSVASTPFMKVFKMET